jgi:probable F420-dependent oxidoreductase
MLFGVCMFSSDEAMNVIELGKAAEERQFESFFVPEHTHIPVNRSTPFPGSAPSLPREYVRTLDPFVALAAVAASTQRIKLGTGICLVVQRDPISTAKSVATIDHLSKGRFLFGVGAGWLREEIANHGTDPRTRWRLFGERMRAMETIWNNDEASFHGQFVNFDPIWSWPKPLQLPRPPVLLGGDVPQAMQRVVEYADEWMPHPDRGEQPLKQRIAEFHSLCEQAHKPKMPVTVYGTPIDERAVDEYRNAGVTRCVFRLPSAPADQVLPALDRATALAR